MWTLFEVTYAGACRTRFEADLAGKHHVFVLRSAGRLVGFSTVAIDHVTVHGRRVVSVFSGDTVIEAAFHGQRALQTAFFRYIAKIKLRYPRRRVVWFLISKGYKTYLLLSRNFVHFYPRHDEVTPQWASELIDCLSLARFPEAWRPETGTLSFVSDHEALRPDVAPVDGLTDPDICYFVERNPGHARGDELCCVGVVDSALLVQYPLKLLRRGRARRSSTARGRSQSLP